MSKEQIEEIRKDIFAAFGGYEKWEEDWQSLAKAVYNAGYRKQSEMLAEFLQMVANICAYEERLSYQTIENGIKRQVAMKGGE